jgi:hypothetical protein
MGRKTCYILVLLAWVCGIVGVTLVTQARSTVDTDAPGQTDAEPAAIDFSRRVPVALNRGPEVQDGFDGETHPALHSHSELEVTANWDFDRNQAGTQSFLSGSPPQVNDLFMKLKVATPTRTYTERDFSRFLPAKEPGAVGQMWAVDLDKCAEFLKQFHPNPSMRLVAKGRRAGPDGAFAVLRAVSPTHLDILLRVHAEFDVLPDREKRYGVASEAWYSPGYLIGRLVINRQSGTVEYFSLGVPTDKRYNIHVTAGYGDLGEGHGWMRVERMELAGGNKEGADRIRWADQIEVADARDRLAKVFYKFKEINWLAFEKVQEAARAQGKPIFVVTAMGALDNQTC